jgi:hypothetical protein
MTKGPAPNQVVDQALFSQFSDPAMPTLIRREGLIPDGNKGVAAVYKTLELPLSNPSVHCPLSQGANPSHCSMLTTAV